MFLEKMLLTNSIDFFPEILSTEIPPVPDGDEMAQMLSAMLYERLIY